MKYKSIIITAVISVLLTSAVGVVAAKLTAKDIEFTSVNEEWQVDNVEDAMNDLYQTAENKRLNVVKVGSGTLGMNGAAETKTFNLSGYEGYKDFELYKNIWINVRIVQDGSQNVQRIPSYSYNKSTGILTTSITSSSNTAFIYFDVYLVTV